MLWPSRSLFFIANMTRNWECIPVIATRIFWCTVTILLFSGAGHRAQILEPTARARIEEKGNAISVWRESKHSGGPVDAGALLRDGDQVTVTGTAKFTWLKGGTISFRNVHGGALLDIGLPAGRETSLRKFAPLFLRRLDGVMDLSIPPTGSIKRRFEFAGYNFMLSTGGATFSVALNDRASAAIVRVTTGEVELEPSNMRLRHITLHSGEEVEVNRIALIHNKNSAIVDMASSTSINSPQIPYFIFVLHLYNYDALYIGTEVSLLDRTRCSFGGGGHCAPDDRVGYQKLLGPFDSMIDARTALCKNVSHRKTFPDAVVKGQWAPNGSWYGLMDESVSFDCHVLR